MRAERNKWLAYSRYRIVERWLDSEHFMLARIRRIATSEPEILSFPSLSFIFVHSQFRIRSEYTRLILASVCSQEIVEKPTRQLIQSHEAISRPSKRNRKPIRCQKQLQLVEIESSLIYWNLNPSLWMCVWHSLPPQWTQDCVDSRLIPFDDDNWTKANRQTFTSQKSDNWRASSSFLINRKLNRHSVPCFLISFRVSLESFLCRWSKWWSRWS